MSDQELVASLRSLIAGQWKMPNIVDCIRFLNQEVAEIDDCALRLGMADKQYIRNNEKEKTWDDLSREIAQAYMMLLTLANLTEVNLSQVLTTEIVRLLRKYSGLEELDLLTTVVKLLNGEEIGPLYSNTERNVTAIKTTKP